MLYEINLTPMSQPKTLRERADEIRLNDLATALHLEATAPNAKTSDGFRTKFMDIVEAECERVKKETEQFTKYKLAKALRVHKAELIKEAGPTDVKAGFIAGIDAMLDYLSTPSQESNENKR